MYVQILCVLPLRLPRSPEELWCVPILGLCLVYMYTCTFTSLVRMYTCMGFAWFVFDIFKYVHVYACFVELYTSAGHLQNIETRSVCTYVCTYMPGESIHENTYVHMHVNNILFPQYLYLYVWKYMYVCIIFNKLWSKGPELLRESPQLQRQL
jgi:hypothetical protein